MLAIPPKALRFMPDETMMEAMGVEVRAIPVENPALQKTVWLKNGEVLEQKEIKTGTATSTLMEVCCGLSEGQEIVVGMDSGLKKGRGPQQAETGASPFMPKPPGSGKKNK